MEKQTVLNGCKTQDMRKNKNHHLT